jgi:hypothetical protein
MPMFESMEFRNILVGKYEGKTRRRWEDNIKMDITEILWKGMDWMRLA